MRDIIVVGIEMSKIMILLVICTVIFIVLVTSYFMNYSSIPKNTKGNQPQNNPPEIAEGPQLVIPESPIGTLGLISALAAGFGMFAIMQKKKITIDYTHRKYRIFIPFFDWKPPNLEYFPLREEKR